MRLRERRAVLGLALTAALFTTAACKSSGTRGTAQNTYSAREGAQTLEEVIANPMLARQLEIESYRSERRDGRLHVQFHLRNKKTVNFPIEWSIRWSDAGGMAIDTERHWTPTVIGGGGFEVIAQTAPTPDAAGFRLELRPPNVVR